MPGKAMSDRRCACGCGASLAGKRSQARYASEACRTRAWKARHGITGWRPVKPSQNGSGRPVALRVSVRKAERVAPTLAADPDAPSDRVAFAMEVLRRSLSERQRQRLDDERRCVSS
jgi:hypothetical protein